MTQNVILMVSESDDQHVRIISQELKKSGIKTHFLQTDMFANQLNSWRIFSNPQKIDYSTWFIESVSTVWYRKRVPVPTTMTDTQSFVFQEREGLLDALLDQYDGSRWVSTRSSLTKARSKLSQLKLAKRLNLRIPDTIVTNSIEELSAFANLYDDIIIAKPIQTQVLGSSDKPLVLGTRTLMKEHYSSATEFAPCYAQEKLSIKSEIRVIVFGDELHAFMLTPKQRTDDLKQLELTQIKHEVHELDSGVREKIRTLMKCLNLEFAAIDFAIIDDGEPVFLELNPNGQWLWLQYMTGKNLCAPFVDFLCR